MNTPRILILGRSGQLATDISGSLGLAREVATFLGRADIDLTDPTAVRDAIARANPDVVINAAAYTDVDKAESGAEERARAFALNATAPGLLAAACAERNVPFVHVSTDYVFPGTEPGARVENDATGPVNVYGESKLAGERAVMAAGGKPLVVRTSWIYGAHGKNFFLTMRRLARVNVRLRVVADQHGAPTSSLTLAQALTRLAWVLHEGGHDFQTNVAGIYHLAAEGQTTWHGFAQAIVEGLRQREAIPCEDVEAIATADFPTPAHRPMHSVLASGLFRRTFLFGLEDWHTGLDGVWRQLDQEA